MHASPSADFVKELLRTGITLADLAGNLIDLLPDDAYPGEDSAQVLVEMLIGSAEPVTSAAGAEAVTSATALICATMDRILDDLRLAADAAA